jgi:hypothetical protein
MQPRVIARSEATKQSRVAGGALGCFASLAMTVGSSGECHESWERHDIVGWAGVRSTVPTVLPR